jgi:SAM-dependent methyltransferase
LRAGHDVDGCDVSADMVASCRRAARAAGYDPTLLVQPLHALEPRRRYRTIVVCGAFGLGSTRAEDEEALTRIRRSLEPGGLLLLDNEVPYANPRRWRRWTPSERGDLPAPWPDEGDRRRAPNGCEYELRSRVVSVDPLDQSETLEIRARKWDERGELVETEQHTLSMRSYFRDELLLLLDRAGFTEVEVTGDYTDEPPTPDTRFLVFHARA